ncbi:hypothetical protein BC830DRAFT_1119224 [Chytriomyces sp. MP71]|nr:hypothetical protein BC830DRAFT_1119224 [Chytriomyces sp. MP71]
MAFSNKHDRFHTTHRVELLLPEGIATEQMLSNRSGAWANTAHTKSPKNSSGYNYGSASASRASTARERDCKYKDGTYTRENRDREKERDRVTRFTDTTSFFDPDRLVATSISRCASPTIDKHSLFTLLVLPPPSPSPAIMKMKATAALKDAEALEYMRKFTTSPYMSKSAKSSKRRVPVNVRPSSAFSTFSNNANQLPAPPPSLMMSYDNTSRNFSATSKSTAEMHAVKLWKLMERNGQRMSSESPTGSPKLSGTAAILQTSAMASTTVISSPLSVKLVADLRDLGVSRETAALVGAAVSLDSNGSSYNHRSGGSSAAASSRKQRTVASADPSNRSVSRIYQNEIGEIDPTVAWPKPEPFLNHNSPHSKARPTGAHSAGFYTKHYHANFTVNAGVHTGPNNPLPVPSSLTMESEFDNTDDTPLRPVRTTSAAPRNTVFNDRISRTSRKILDFSTDGEGDVSKRKSLCINEVAITDEHLCILTDPECSTNQVEQSLSVLIALAIDNENVASSTLFDRGGVTILLHLMQRPSVSADILTKACRLLEIMSSKNRKTEFYEHLFKQNGILPLLRAVQTISKGEIIIFNFLSLLSTVVSDLRQRTQSIYMPIIPEKELLSTTVPSQHHLHSANAGLNDHQLLDQNVNDVASTMSQDG